jgi:hypothetical protein
MTRRVSRTRSAIPPLAVGAISLIGAIAAPPPAAADEVEPAVPAAGSHRYVGVRKCRTCHKKELLGNQIATWQQGPHRAALETLRNERSVALAQQLELQLPSHQAPECLRCHVTAYALPEIAFAYELEATDGVQCESCHGPGRDYRKKKVMSDPKAAAKNGLWNLDRGTAVCATCHNPQSPTWDPERYALEGGGGAGFDFDQALKRIAHPIPKDTKGRYLEIEKRLKEQGLEVE